MKKKTAEKVNEVKEETEVPELPKEMTIERITEGPVHRIIVRKKLPGYYIKTSKVSNQLKLSLGMRFALVKFDGIQLELISYCLINMIYSKKDYKIIIGVVLSGFIYICYTYLAYKL